MLDVSELGGDMRTTLAIDDDVLAAARSLAERQHASLGQVISQLARSALRGQAPSTAKRNGIPLLARRADSSPVTMELVNQLREEPP
jgi:hypothetical protein